MIRVAPGSSARLIAVVHRMVVASLVAGLAGVGLGVADAQDGVFSSAQAERGGRIFADECSACHTVRQAADLMAARGGGALFPDFLARVSATMPPFTTDRPEQQSFIDILGYLSLSLGNHSGNADATPQSLTFRTARIPTNAPLAVGAAKPPEGVGWTYWRGSIGGTAYSPADAITPENVKSLRIVWRWSSAGMGATPEARNSSTPLMIDGVLYATAGLPRNVVAIDAMTGETLWMWRAAEDLARFENAPRKGSGRGVAYWTDGKRDKRIFTVTPGFQLVALDALTGRPVAKFGKDGKVDLMEGLRGAPKDGLPDIGNSSPPLVIGDVVVVGPAHQVGLRPRSRVNVKGDVRAFNARTGKLLWTFRTIPAKGDPGHETWAPGTAEYSGNAGVWAPMSADSKTGLIYLPVEAATSDLFGGERPGANLYSSSLVALDSRTGKVRWAQQLVHHDIWDWDVPALPILADIPAQGRTVAAVLQITKQGFVFAFDRVTGVPLWPIEERPTPRSDIPGESLYPTQPMPTLPLPFDRQGISVDDLIDFSPALRAEAIENAKPFRLGAFMAPPSLQAAPDGTNGTLSLPSTLGGGNWEGGAFDPETGMLYVGSMTSPDILSLTPAPPGSDIPYIAGGGRPPTVQGLPLVKPPYGRITAIDMRTGQHVWMMANADTPASIRDNPALQGAPIPRTGVPSRAGLLVTKTLLFAGEGATGTPVFRAHDKATGAILAEIALPGTQTGLPMTYVLDGKQYIVVATAGGGGRAAEIVALALPD